MTTATNDTKIETTATPRVTIAGTAPDTEAPELTVRQVQILEAISRFIDANGEYPKTKHITSPEGKAAGLPSRYTIDRTFGELVDGAWVCGWSTLKPRYLAWAAAVAKAA